MHSFYRDPARRPMVMSSGAVACLAAPEMPCRKGGRSTASESCRLRRDEDARPHIARNSGLFTFWRRAGAHLRFSRKFWFGWQAAGRQAGFRSGWRAQGAQPEEGVLPLREQRKTSTQQNKTHLLYRTTLAQCTDNISGAAHSTQHVHELCTDHRKQKTTTTLRLCPYLHSHANGGSPF